MPLQLVEVICGLSLVLTGGGLSETNLYVVAKFRAKPGLEDVVKKELSALLVPTRAEAGCISYDCHQSQDDPAIFVFYELWKNREELDKHLNEPHLQALLGKVDDLFDEAPDIQFLNKLS